MMQARSTTIMACVVTIALTACSTTSDVISLAQNDYLVRARMSTSAIHAARAKAEQPCFEGFHAGLVERPVDIARARADLHFSCGGNPEFRYSDPPHTGENDFVFRLNANNPQLADAIASRSWGLLA